MDFKQVIVLRKDITLSTEAIIRLIAHTSMIGAERSKEHNKKVFQSWLNFGQKKITTRVADLDTLQNLHRECERRGIIAVLVTLPGDMQTTDPTSKKSVSLVIGPDLEKKVDPITRSLKLY